MKWLILLILLFIVNCGTVDNHNKPVSQPLSIDNQQQLQSKFDLYSKLSASQQDINGFIMTNACDSLLFSGLMGTVKSVNILAARDSNGMWHRRPLNYPECWDGSATNSTISRDMLLGLLWYIWSNKRLDLAEQLFTYGEAHNWIMGKGDISRAYFVPGLQATLSDMIYHLGGPNRLTYRSIPQFYTPNTGYEAHLDALNILLRAEILGEMDAQAMNLISGYYKINSNNALFSYVYHRYTDGDQTNTVRVLLETSWFPDDRLPASTDRDEPWLWQRDFGSSWEPDNTDPPRTWSGGDFLFVAKLLLGN